MMEFIVRVIKTKRTLRCCYIVAECKVKLIHIAALSRDRCDCVVRLAVCLGKHISLLVRVASPCLQDVVCKVDDSLLIRTAETYYR